MQTRIYLVRHNLECRLVDASSAAQAIRHVVADRYTAKPATAKDIAVHMSAGVAVETAGEAPAPIESTSASAQQQTATY